MLRRSALALLVSPVMALAVAIAADAPGDANSAKLSTYESPAGDAYFALSLPPVAGQAAAFDHDVVVLFDTSASQTGAYRDDALQSLKTLLGQLGKSDRVKLMAVDLDAVPMTPDFVAPGSDEMKAGLAKLEGRAPLGSTDMRSALKGAADSFTGAPARPRCVVYIGDGISRANVLQPSDLAATVQTLLDKRASVSSFAIGPGRDVHLLAAVANHTGGMVYLDSSEGHWAERAGQAMADVVRTPVYWPTEVKLPEAIREAYPKTMPPLRGDRDTVVIGLLQSRDVKDVSLTAEVDGKPVKLSWNVAVNNALDDYSFLPQLVDGARDNGGIGLPTLGSASLQEVAKMASANNELLAKLGRNALRVGDKEGALKVADAVLKRDPNHPQAQLIRDAAQRQGNGADDADLRLVNLQDPAAPDAAPPAPGGVGGLLAEVQAGGGDFLANVENSRQVLEQKLKTEVELAVNQARDQMGTNPEGAKRELKIQLETIEKSPDLGPDTRAQLKNQIESAIREAGRKAIEVAARTALAEENRAAAEERQQLVEETARTQQKIRQLMDRFNNLIDEGRYTEAEDIIAAQVRELDPFGTAPLAATWAARIGGHWNTMWAVREVRARNFARSLMEVEKAAVPFPDDPPVGYPEAQVWADLTLRRKKYASIDLARQGSAEQKIFSALEDDTRLEFIETPLNSVIDFLKDQHDINIEIDTKALDDIGVGTDSPITRNLKGISLRSALRLMLKDLGLTYVVKDEVLLITTPEEAESKLVTKVYPVGDLVIPIQSGMMGGMMGGMGGGMMGGSGYMSVAIAQNLRQLIQESINPDSWYELNELGEGTIMVYPTQQPKKLAIYQTPDVHQQIGELLDQLRRALGHQVSIEARFLVVSENFLEDIGLDVDFSYNFGGKWGLMTVSQTSYDTALPDASTKVPGSLGSLINSPAATATGGYGSILDDLQVSLLFRATQGRTDSKALVAPKVTVLSGESANFALNNTVTYALPPDVTQSSAVGGTGATSTTQGIYQNIGLVMVGSNLSVSPTITKDKKNVLLNIVMLQNDLLRFRTHQVEALVDTDEQEGTTVQTLPYEVTVPETEASTVMTRVSVPDGGTLLLGGHKVTAEVDKEVGVPVLSKIPVVGRLFSNRSKIRDNKILLILVKPTIILQEEREEDALAALEAGIGNEFQY